MNFASNTDQACMAVVFCVRVCDYSPSKTGTSAARYSIPNTKNKANVSPSICTTAVYHSWCSKASLSSSITTRHHLHGTNLQLPPTSIRIYISTCILKHTLLCISKQQTSQMYVHFKIIFKTG